MQLRLPLFLVSTIVVVARAASISDVSNGLREISAQAVGFKEAVDAFPPIGGTANDFSKIQARVRFAKYTLNATASDIKAIKGPISESEGQSILIPMADVVRTAVVLLKTFVAKKPAFELAAFVGAIDLVKQDLKDLMDEGSHIAGVLISWSPPGVGAQLNQSTAIIINAFKEAIELYS